MKVKFLTVLSLAIALMIGACGGKSDADLQKAVSDKLAADKVTGATINGTGSLLMRAERVGRDTMLSQIVRMVAAAQRSRAPIQALAHLRIEAATRA